MPQQELSPASKRLTIFIGLTVVGAMAFGLSISFYRNILFDETLKELASRNRNLRTQIDLGLEELAYYRSHQYRDKYAKENLGRLNPGERVLILANDELDVLMEEGEQLSYMEERTSAYHQYLEQIPVIEHWRMYLFDPEGLERLRQSF